MEFRKSTDKPKVEETADKKKAGRPKKSAPPFSCASCPAWTEDSADPSVGACHINPPEQKGIGAASTWPPMTPANQWCQAGKDLAAKS